ncbi:response regulator [Aerosakkonemataceae cyanobacterium BLCC-F154]|uniref:Response regulator n=1 Tax=Floridaenema fluviatile BLCC-F154 TaxID=3153640 RepID=A0ABV4YE51_9CYAN
MNKKILVVDDDEAIQEVIKSCLQELAGWQVLLAGSGLEGLRIANSEPLDAILLDISMPEMNGIQMLRKLQENLTTKTIPVFLLTARNFSPEREQFLQLPQVAGIIIKPFNAIKLVEQVAQSLGWKFEFL